MQRFDRNDAQSIRSVYARRRSDSVPHFQSALETSREKNLRYYTTLQYDALLQKAEEDISVFSALINHANDAFFVAEPVSGDLLYVNDTACTHLGCSRQELLSMNLADIFPARAGSAAWEQALRTVREEGGLQCETEIVNANGGIAPAELSVHICRHGKREYAIAVSRDITRRRQSEEHLLSVTRALRMLSKCNEAIVHANGEVSLLTEACRILVDDGGYRAAWVSSPEDGLSTGPIIRTDQKQECSDMRTLRVAGTATEKSAMATGRPCLHRYAGAESASKKPCASILALPLLADTKRTLSICASEGGAFDTEEIKLLQDMCSKLSYGITSVKVREEHRLAAKTLSQTLHELESIMFAIPDILFRTDLNGNLMMWNKAFEMFTGLTPAALSGRPASSFFAEPDRPSVAAALAACRAGGANEVELPLLNQCGVPVVYNWKTALMKDECGTPVGILSIARDITGHRRAEENERRLQSQLLQAQKMEAIGQLAGGIAHDFNNILTAIIGYGSIIVKKLPEADKNRVYADNIVSAANRAANLTRSLLTFSRKQTINPQPTNVNTIVEGVEKLLRRVIGEDIEVTMELRHDIAPVLADAGQLEQVLINLATNARDAMPGGGRLSIATRMGEISPEFITSNGYGQPGACVLITVSDTGTGMTPETRQRIFEPFFTTKEVGRGTGLGLSMAYGSVKQHNGYIVAESEPGLGTNFTIYLPAVSQKARDAVSEGTVSSAPGGTETILLAEDDATVRRLEKSVLEDAGYTVIEAVDGQDAVDKLRTYGEHVQLLISDVIMPKKSGGEVFEEAKRIRPGIRALFASGYPAEIVKNRDVLGRALHFVSKPISPRDFLQKVREALDQK